MKKIFKKETEKQALSLFLMLSFGIHVVLAILFLNLNDFWGIFRRDDKIIEPASIRVDMVGLPDLPLKKETVEAKKEKPVLLPEKTKKKTRKKEKDSKQTKDLKKKEVVKTQKKKKDSPVTKQKINKGNQIAEGAKKGAEILSSQQTAEINIYMAIVIEQVRARYNLPKYLTDHNLTAQIEIRINSNGEMIYKQIASSSNNELFDSQVLKAIENAAPYPPPPDSVKDLIKDGIIFTF